VANQTMLHMICLSCLMHPLLSCTDGNSVCLKGSHGFYITARGNALVSCSSTNTGKEERFTIEFAPDDVRAMLHLLQ